MRFDVSQRRRLIVLDRRLYLGPRQDSATRGRLCPNMSISAAEQKSAQGTEDDAYTKHNKNPFPKQNPSLSPQRAAHNGIKWFRRITFSSRLE